MRMGQKFFLLLCLGSIVTFLFCMVKQDAVDMLLEVSTPKVSLSASATRESATVGDMKLVSPLLPLLVTTAASSPWTWTCDPFSTFCTKERHVEGRPHQGEAMCRLSCAPSTLLWPMPTSQTIEQGVTASISPGLIATIIEAPSDEIRELVMVAKNRQVSYLTSQGSEANQGLPMILRVEVVEETLQPEGAQEGYTLSVKLEDEHVTVNILATTYFGARHAFETLFQMAAWDAISSSFNIAASVEIEDVPFFPHRGVMLDTARNFIPVPKILQLVDSMSFTKMNVFHWHITDSQSFPLFLPSLPGFASYGAYSEEQVYTPDQVKQVVDYARAQGIQVIPELDAPAHVGAGWEAVAAELTLCVNREPWTEWCVEPPCGQLNPVIPELYEVLKTMYGDWMAMLRPTTFHIGGDEVHLGCWNSSSSILAWLQSQGKGDKEEDFMFLWSHFLTESTDSLDIAASALGLESPRLILWNNQLTHPEHIHHLDKDKYTIQLWTDSTNLEDLTIKTVAEAGFKMIFSNHDATYLDCGFGAWVGNGHNWCSPYKQWQVQYLNDPLTILEKQNVSNLAEAQANVVGGEVAMWTEQADGDSIMTKIEPRAAAYAERLWRGPLTSSNWVEAERRLVIHRERIARRGITADSMTHGWCRQNEGKCILEGGYENMAPIF